MVMQYFKVFSVLYVYGYRLNINKKARNKPNQIFVLEDPFRFAIM